MLYVHADISIFLLRRTKGTGQGVPLCDVCVERLEAVVVGAVNGKRQYDVAVDVQIRFDFTASSDDLYLTVMSSVGIDRICPPCTTHSHTCCLGRLLVGSRTLQEAHSLAEQRREQCWMARVEVFDEIVLQSLMDLL